MVDERHDLNAALVFARFCVAPEYGQLVPVPLNLVRETVLFIYKKLPAYVAPERIRPRPKDASDVRPPGVEGELAASSNIGHDTDDVPNRFAGAGNLLDYAYQRSGRSMEVHSFINRACSPEVTFFPEAAVEYASRHFFRVEQRCDFHQRA